MDFAGYLHQQLKLSSPNDSWPLAIDLFAGCGGLALGFEAAGFRTIGFETNEDCCRTYRRNLHGQCNQTFLRPAEPVGDHADVVIGGPPCQPFSVGGLQEGHNDDRDGFPAFLAVVAHVRPKLVMFENVRGMLYQNRPYFDQIVARLRKVGYRISQRLLNAVNFGVPQRRERLFVVAHQGGWEWPAPEKRVFTAGEALEGLGSSIPPGSKFLTASMDEYVAKYEKASKCIRPRDLHFDEPSRTVTCRNLNGATGDMFRVRLPDGRRRRLVVREGARLQGFPDWFEFCGSEGSQFNQVGNAVPPLLGRALALRVREYLDRLTAGISLEDDWSDAEQLALEFGHG